jgi:hypothetical protein
VQPSGYVQPSRYQLMSCLDLQVAENKKGSSGRREPTTLRLTAGMHRCQINLQSCTRSPGLLYAAHAK